PAAPSAVTPCGYSVCNVTFTAPQMLDLAQKLVLERNFTAAKPLLIALANQPQYTLQVDFMNGYIAVENGDYKTAIRLFRKILLNHPKETRVRLELARALLITGHDAAAEHHFRLAAQDKNLPPDVVATIQSSRSLLRDRRTWSFSVDFGIVPDTNINNGTTAQTVDFNLGGLIIPLTLGNTQRQQTGIGENVVTSGTLRLKLAGSTKLLIEEDTDFTRYPNPTFNDFTAQLAAGPEFQLSPRTTLNVEALANEHLYGSISAGTAGGIRSTWQHDLNQGARMGITIDARHTSSGFSTIYSGWQFAGYASYERVVMHSLVASVQFYGRRDLLNSASYASTSEGVNLGLGGELPHGFNAGISAGASHAGYDGADPTCGLGSSAYAQYCPQSARNDWAYYARAYVGLRTIHVAGFSPSFSVTWNRNVSNYALYDLSRFRVRFGLMKYF
ncbi:MAG: DUF560 domain-containing protein, partial [Alphaproteobacteria bacterium]|nr:DUF560 domain-containing protein [Alphaproteobacteria bacterium]